MSAENDAPSNVTEIRAKIRERERRAEVADREHFEKVETALAGLGDAIFDLQRNAKSRTFQRIGDHFLQQYRKLDANRHILVDQVNASEPEG